MKYELTPTDSRKSFYRKAFVTDENGIKTLTSYDTDVIKMMPDGTLIALWDGWSATTGRHIRAFCGLNKAGYMALLKKGE